MLGDIVLLHTMSWSRDRDEGEEYKNNITCNVISCSAYKYNHHPKATFTVHEISVNVNMCFQSLNNMISRFARSNLDFSQIWEYESCARKTVYRHDHVDPNNGLDAV